MWIFMQVCYALSILTFFMLFLGFIQSFLHFNIVRANHVTFMILTSIIYSLTETLVIFFFVGTGVSIKEYTQMHKLDPIFTKESFKMKMKVYPPLLLNILFMVTLFVLVGAVDTHRIPEFVYQILYLICMAHFLYAIIIQHECFKVNTDIILRMSGLKS